MIEEIIETAASVMRVSVSDARDHYKKIDGLDAYYFWNPIRGGIAVIIDDKGEKLAATSSISFNKHLQAFLDGKRN